MKYKKAQSEIITTVLIILLVLAAVVIVWQVVQGTLNRTSTQVTQQGSCMGISIEAVKASGTTVTITRRAGAADSKVIGFSIIVDGAIATVTYPGTPADGSLKEFETKPYTLATALTVGQKVEIAPILDGNINCNPAATIKAVAP
jgi:flagellin-like protein